MSEERIGVLRELYERWAEGDLRASEGLIDQTTELRIRPEFPESGTYRGPVEIRAYTRELLASFDQFRIEAEEFRDAGDRVLVRVHQRGVGRASGVEAAVRYFQVWTFADQALVQVESIMDERHALEAAGLLE